MEDYYDDEDEFEEPPKQEWLVSIPGHGYFVSSEEYFERVRVYEHDKPMMETMILMGKAGRVMKSITETEAKKLMRNNGRY